MRVLPVGPDLVVSALKKATLLHYLPKLGIAGASRLGLLARLVPVFPMHRQGFLIGQSVIRPC
jgi:hypothetical protein